MEFHKILNLIKKIYQTNSRHINREKNRVKCWGKSITVGIYCEESLFMGGIDLLNLLTKTSFWSRHWFLHFLTQNHIWSGKCLAIMKTRWQSLEKQRLSSGKEDTVRHS